MLHSTKYVIPAFVQEKKIPKKCLENMKKDLQTLFKYVNKRESIMHCVAIESNISVFFLFFILHEITLKGG